MNLAKLLLLLAGLLIYKCYLRTYIRFTKFKHKKTGKDKNCLLFKKVGLLFFKKWTFHYKTCLCDGGSSKPIKPPGYEPDLLCVAIRF